MKLNKLMFLFFYIEYKTRDTMSAVQGEVPTSTNECSNMFRSWKDIFIEQRRMENINNYICKDNTECLELVTCCYEAMDTLS